jgi:hypothetical protein
MTRTRRIGRATRRLLPMLALGALGAVALWRRRTQSSPLGQREPALPSPRESPSAHSPEPYPASDERVLATHGDPFVLPQLDDDLRQDARYERKLFIRLLVILLIVALALAARAIFL